MDRPDLASIIFITLFLTIKAAQPPIVKDVGDYPKLEQRTLSPEKIGEEGR